MRGARLRHPLLLATSALALHGLRYLLFPEPGLADRHEYLGALSAAVAVALAATLALGLGRATTVSRGRRPRLVAIALTAVGLVVVFCAQEATESLASTGSATLAPALGAGGWCVAPLALALAAVTVLFAETPVPGGAVATGLRRALPLPPAVLHPSPTGAATADRVPLAWHLAGRAPPA